MTGGLAVACGLAALHLAGATGTAMANGAYDSQLFSLTNQDRTSNGVHSLRFSGTLQNIGEGAPYNCRGVQVSGRSVDMIRRNYFAHPILGCGEYVFSMMQAFGIHYRSAGENIGWVAYSSSPAGYINGAFMNSSDHRANILSPNYTEMGVGSDESAPGVTWTGQGSEQDVWMFSEEFAQVGSSSPPPPPGKPRPKPVARNSPAPAPPAAPGVSITPAATPSTSPTPTPLLIPAGSLPQDLPAPPVGGYEGLFPNTIESVLEAFLTF
ncbi:MAG: CAP domain-containing protein [Candidatus Dormiibacterota bacterium]